MSKALSQELHSSLDELREQKRKIHKDILRSILSDNQTFQELHKTDRDLIEKITQLYHHGLLTEEEKRSILSTIQNLVNQVKQGEVTKELEYTIARLIDLIEHEMEFLDYVPGVNHRQYLRMTDLVNSAHHNLTVNKGHLELRANELFFEDKKIQGVRVIHGVFGYRMEITGEHYSSQQVIREIYQDGRISSAKAKIVNPGNDPYCYLAEPGKLNGKSMKEVRRITGAARADSCITVKAIVALHHVWIRPQKGYPAKFAIETKKLPVHAPKMNKGYRVRINEDFSYIKAA